MNNNDILPATILVLAESIERTRLNGRDDAFRTGRENIEHRFDYWLEEVADDDE